MLVAVAIPGELFARIWLGHPRELVALAFVAAFSQQPVWQAVSQIGEAARNTLRVQLFNVGIACAYMGTVSFLAWHGKLTIELVLSTLIAQYLVAIAVGFGVVRRACCGASLPLAPRECWSTT